MDNFNSFKPPVDASNGEPILPTEPENSSATEHDDSPIPEPEEKLDADETISEKVGATSDENGYGTDPMGRSKERNNLGTADYNKQVGQRVSEVYAAAEKDLEAEEKAAFPGWYDDESSTPQAETDPTPPEGSPAQSKDSPALSETTTTPSETILKAETVRVLEGAIHAKKIADEKFYSVLENLASNLTKANESTTSESQPTVENSASTTPTLDTVETPTESINAAPATASTEVRNETIAAPSASSENVGTTVPEKPATAKTLYTGKGGLMYDNRQDAIDSFKD